MKEGVKNLLSLLKEGKAEKEGVSEDGDGRALEEGEKSALISKTLLPSSLTLLRRNTY